MTSPHVRSGNRAVSNRDLSGRTLYVYECRGPRLPRTQPVDDAFLGIWPEPPYYYLFFSEPADTCLKQWIQSEPQWFVNDHYRIAYRAWQDVLQAGERVGPFHLVARGFGEGPDPDALPVLLDRGIVFGSGVHPTTRGCLLALDRLFRRGVPKTVVDLGTGSGILAIAAARLGARRVFALDCNLMAVHEALRNIAHNGLTGRIHPLVADGLGCLNTDADLIIMNLEWPCLQEVLQHDAWQRHPQLILSGFIAGCLDSLEERLGKDWNLIDQVEIDGWPTVTARESR